jgi:hydroxyethylthiazole kinase
VPGGSGWVDLNGATVKKFSDADFPTWDKGWVLVDGSRSVDSRCVDANILVLLDLNHDQSVTPQEAQSATSHSVIQERLGRKICKFATEWDASTVESRFGWLRTDPRTRMSVANFARLRAHTEALAFWPAANLGLAASCWHFHPRMFVRHFRQCGWLSLNELAQLLPRRAGHRQGHTTPVAWADATRNLGRYVAELNQTFRKYNLLNANRQTHFLAQTYIETGLWTAMREGSRGRPSPAVPMAQYYAAFYGRGSMQLTWPANYAAYGRFRRFAHAAGYQDARITQVSVHYWESPFDRNGQLVGVPRAWSPRYDPEIVADDPYAASDSGGFYWISKHHAGHWDINREADQGVTPTTVGRISVLVNGGGYGYSERQSYAAFVHRYRDDGTDTSPTGNFTAQHGQTQLNIFVDYAPQRP